MGIWSKYRDQNGISAFFLLNNGPQFVFYFAEYWPAISWSLGDKKSSLLNC